MTDPLSAIGRLCPTPPDAILWACVLEASAPKVGNVYPGKPFEDITYSDFVIAGEIASNGFSSTEERISQRTLRIVSRIRDRVDSNINLGILLLLGPLLGAEENSDGRIEDTATWQKGVAKYLSQLDEDDGRFLFDAIALSSPGGMGKVDEMDVADHVDQPIDLMDAMRSAKHRDRIAMEYSTGYEGFFQETLPIVGRAIGEAGDLLSGIASAHLQLLACQIDTLIARKNGQEAALDVQTRAQAVDPASRGQVDQFDRFLRSRGHQLNPGTTADLIAASLYVLLRQNSQEKTRP